MINVLMLFSGSSQAFAETGYRYPKNLVEIDGLPLVQRVLEQFSDISKTKRRLICLIGRDENRRHHTGAVIKLVAPEAQLIEVNGDTSGAACSALLAVEHINNDEPLIIVNGDQLLVGVDPESVVDDFRERSLDAGTVVFEDLHPRWSFVKCNDSGLVIETAEKRPISKLATAGFYYFQRGKDFVFAATEMIKKDAHTGEKFYICPALNELILRQMKIGVFKIPKSSYKSLATPSDVQAYNGL